MNQAFASYSYFLKSILLVSDLVFPLTFALDTHIQFVFCGAQIFNLKRFQIKIM